MNECNEAIKRMQRTSQKVSNHKYFLRNCEALAKVIDLENHPDIIPFTPQEEKQSTELMSQVEKFSQRWGKQK
ncbi:MULTISPECIES: hypothetical protein [unclassified Lysinibacillus]|uniref:hypothetical protein n=1 Tax=unclassified Lysinibacillus TaxID=2636778 RepID=UPI0037F406EB